MKIHEIFFSIQGESSYAGVPCAFVRLAGCNLRCSYCDTRHAYEEGDEMTIEQVVERVERFRAPLVEVTGGEPLLQPETPNLVRALADKHYKILIETNGSIPLGSIDARATIIMDVKCPGSGMSEHMLWKNLEALRPHDEVKFVLSDRYDYDWALDVIRTHRLSERHIVHLSPAFGVLEPRELAAWMLESRRRGSFADGWNVRFHLQLHKYIWPGVERGV